MTPWTIRQQKVYVRGDLSLEFKRSGSHYLVDVAEADGGVRRITFGPGGEVHSVRLLTPAPPAVTV